MKNIALALVSFAGLNTFAIATSDIAYGLFNPDAFETIAAAKCKIQKGEASWYGGMFQGRLTANGEVFNTHETKDLTAAHRTLPLGSKVRVTNKRTGLSIVVRINDRGPYKNGRVIDVSQAAAKALKMEVSGIDPVEVSCI